MGLGNEIPPTYLTINHDEEKIRHKDGDTEVLYDYLTGRPTGVELKKDSYQGEEYYRYYFEFVDGDDRYLLQSSEGTMFSRGLLNALAGTDDPSKALKVVPWKRDGDRSCVALVYYAGTEEKCEWAVPPEDIPDTDRAVVGDKEVFDDSKRRKFFRRVAAKVNKILSEAKEPTQPDPPETSDERPSQNGGLGSSSPTDAYAETGTVKMPDNLEELEDIDDLPI